VCRIGFVDSASVGVVPFEVGHVVVVDEKEQAAVVADVERAEPFSMRFPVEEVVVGGGAIEVAVDLDKLVAGHIARHVQ